MLRMTLALAILSLPHCGKDETLASYGASGATWQLHSINDQPLGAPVTLQIDGDGKLSGIAPCNSYTATVSVPYPWFEIKDLTATRASCALLEAEGTYFAALLAMTQSEVSGSTLILRTDAGSEMVFKAVE
ncbi:META domain-containing protein [Phaeobacter gallaeciensis]|uniref:META domain-containing protein n=2 Tax=Roseobacteraceae TaxID=2854170 RepID=A0A366WMD8_9RHOB|nr:MULTISPECIES: META domain-containing protein [Roseobacteraceae]MBT3140200.1 META domain-containing protein [Falsiruegeria litorea]MBT8169041.1 META domain-containing protein [Falsiruegeria litorea]RBW50483.1 META domain-containing protein [Phaeobacter gallaeciensis]